MQINRKISIFVVPNNTTDAMKYTELHKIILLNGWTEIPGRGKGSHKRYTKDGKIYTVPFHKGKEIGNSFAKGILKDLGITQ